MSGMVCWENLGSPGRRLALLSHVVLWEGEDALSEAHGDPAQALGCRDQLIKLLWSLPETRAGNTLCQVCFYYVMWELSKDALQLQGVVFCNGGGVSHG